MRHHPASLFAPILLLAPLAAAQPMVIYDAASGVGPSSQCWLYEGSSPPTPSVGVLDFGSSGGSEYRYFFRSDLGQIDFTQSAVITARVQVVSGAYAGNPCGAGERAGVGFAVVDAQGRHLNVGLGSDRVYIGTQNNPFDGPSNPSAAYTWGGAMRDMRLEVNNLTFTLLIDGVPVVSVSRPDMPTGQTTPNFCMFGGDITGCAPGHGRFERFTLTAIPAGGGGIAFTSQPGPQVLACANSPLVLGVNATSPWALGYQWRRNGVPITDGPAAAGAFIEGALSPLLNITGYAAVLDGQYDCVLVNSCGSRTTTSTTVTLPAPCGPADVGRQGGVACPDGLLDNNDFVVFIDYFFEHSPVADRGVQGGVPGTDNAWDNNDFVVYIDQFFSGC